LSQPSNPVLTVRTQVLRRARAR